MIPFRASLDPRQAPPLPVVIVSSATASVAPKDRERRLVPRSKRSRVAERTL
jgi:hypothetical protein